MTNEEVARILDPETRRKALAEIEYYGGFRGGDAVIEASNEACRIASEVLRRGTSHPSDRGAWISVKDRLPKDRGNVLVVAFWHERWDVYMGWCAPKRSEWSVHIGIGDRSDVAVSHWMPLPEPPEEGQV